jgi:hypothetical protein
MFARTMWTLYEPVHAVVYFTAVGRVAFEEAGLRGFWRGYFAGRAAPLGEVGPAVVGASFFTFAPSMVERAVPEVWRRAAVDEVLDARLAAATGALTSILGDEAKSERIDEAAELLWEAASGLRLSGRVLASANASLPAPGHSLGRLWQAATTLREHRGDGHFAALVAADIEGCEANAWRCGHDLDRSAMQQARGWTDEQWDAALRRLGSRGYLDGDRMSEAGRVAYQAVEDATDRAAAEPWERLGPDRTRRLAESLLPIARACRTAIPLANPIGLPVPTAL